MSEAKKLAIVSGLVEGVSIRSLERMTGAHSDSIVRLLWRVGDGCSRLLFVRPHVTLKTTPAMAAGVTDHFWTLENLLTWEAPYSVQASLN